MAKPTRSPVLGYNHNVKYRGRIYHVQSEDSGPLNPRIFTHLYFGGTILASKKHDYDPAASEESVRTLMQGQHKSILKDLKASRHDDRLSQFFAARGELFDLSAMSAADSSALDLDAAPPPVSPTPMVIRDEPTAPNAVVFSDSFEDEPTTPDHAANMAKMARKDGTPAPESPRSPGMSPAIGAPPENPLRRSAIVTPVMGTPVTIQRTVKVGGDAGVTPPPVPPARGKRPAPAFPYVVKEGSHPLANPQNPASAPPALPPAQSMIAAAGRPTTSVRPMTAGRPANAARTTGASTRPAEPFADKSLDEVILAYLAQGDDEDAR